MKTWRDNRVTRLNTAKGLAHALSFNLGSKNSIIQLVELDRNRLEELKNIFSSLVNQCGEYYSRVNIIKFHKGCHELELDSDSDLDYTDEGNEDELDSDNDLLGNYFLSENNTQTYVESPIAIFSKGLMTTGTKVVHWFVNRKPQILITNVRCQKD